MAAGYCGFLIIFCSLLICPSFQSNVLITGGAGFIGYHLSQNLNTRGDSVIVIDNFNKDYDVKIKKARATQLTKTGITVHEGDACDKPLLTNLIKSHSINVIVHLAARTSLTVSIDDPISLVHSNVECQFVILELLKDYKDIKLLYVSSADTFPNPSSSPPSVQPPRNLYAAFKMASLDAIVKFCMENTLNVIGVRPFYVYGPWGRPDEDIYKMAVSVTDGSPLEVYKTSSDQSFGRDYIFIDDVIKGMVAAINYPPGNTCDKIYNLGGGSVVTMPTVVHLLEAQLNKKANIKYASLPAHEMDSFPADLTLTQQDLAVSPEITIEQGVKKFATWFLDNNNKQLQFSEPSHDLRKTVEKDHIKQRNQEIFERLRKLKEKYANYLKSKGRPAAILYKEKNFIEKKGKYFGGGDGARVVASRNINEMKEICRFVDECVGFTSDGHMKQYIGPESQWSSRSGQSLYLADINVCEAGMHNCFGNYTCTHLGPAQFKCGCVNGWGLVDSNHCVELYRKGHETEVEKEERIADKMIGRVWKDFVRNADFVSFKSKESPEGNLAYLPHAKGNVELLKEACRDSYHCMGFNTNGLLKKIIRRPSNWKSSGGTLYVLDVDYCHMSLSCPRGRHCHKQAPGKYDCS